MSRAVFQVLQAERAQDGAAGLTVALGHQDHSQRHSKGEPTMCINCLRGHSPHHRPAPQHLPGRRALLAGLAGMAGVLAATRAMSQITVSDRTVVAPIGLTRTVLQSHTNADGSEFHLILDIFPPGIVVPPHRHPVVGFNYILEGQGESRYEGQDLLSFGPGDTFQDLNTARHVQFRNVSETKPLLVLLSYTVPKGQSFFIAE